jgi:hypothetical protein
LILYSSSIPSSAKNHQTYSALSSQKQQQHITSTSTSSLISTANNNNHISSTTQSISSSSSVSQSQLSAHSFDWFAILKDSSVRGAPVGSFSHAPLSETWDSLVTIGVKVEVKNRDFPSSSASSLSSSANHNHNHQAGNNLRGANKARPEFHWIANIVKVAGKFGLNLILVEG